jgi:HNH endonuclease
VQIIITATLDQIAAARACGDQHDPPGPVLSDVEGFARAQHGTPVHPQTLALLACSGRLRRVLLDRRGAVLDLGRRERLASPAQKRALLARDGGCVVPGCVVPGGACDFHHPTAWTVGGRTEIDNLALLCPRHHSEVHDGGSWQIVMIHGVPWVRPPAWVYPSRELLPNTVHRPRWEAG